MEILRVTFEAGETHTFHKSGRYFEVMKASAPFDAWFTDRAIGVYPCLGLEAGVYSELPFQQLQITSATAQTVTLLISDFRAGFRGSQDTQNNINSNILFASTTQTAGAGLYPCVTLAAYTKTLAVSLHATCGSGFSYQLRGNHGTLETSGISIGRFPAVAGSVIDASCRYNTITAQIPTGLEIANQSNILGKYIAYPGLNVFSEPVILYPGQVLAILSPSAADFLSVNATIKQLD